jgi:hypothetical protein
MTDHNYIRVGEVYESSTLECDWRWCSKCGCVRVHITKITVGWNTTRKEELRWYNKGKQPLTFNNQSKENWPSYSTTQPDCIEET